MHLSRIVPSAKAREPWKTGGSTANQLPADVHHGPLQSPLHLLHLLAGLGEAGSAEILRYEELLRIVRAAASAGIPKVRVTGGEPLVRRGVVDFIRDLHQVPGIREVCLTTNGVRLQELAPSLYDAGLRHLNVSLDTLRRDRYRRITGRDHLEEVMEGLKLAAALGFQPLKINCVVLKGINDDELVDLAQLARHYPYQVRFIELMPTADRKWWRHHFLAGGGDPPAPGILRPIGAR